MMSSLLRSLRPLLPPFFVLLLVFLFAACSPPTTSIPTSAPTTAAPTPTAAVTPPAATPSAHDHMGMGAGQTMTGTMPMGDMAAMMGMMQGMMGMMSGMGPNEQHAMMTQMMDMMTSMMPLLPDLPPAQRQEMMGRMLDMMAAMMPMMNTMTPEAHGPMMNQMMGMMNQMMGMMDDMPPAAHQQMMDTMMKMMSQMQGMMEPTSGGHTMGAMGSTAGDHMVPIPAAGVPAATTTVGGQPLAFTLEDGVKVFRLTARPVRWNILKDVTVTAWTYNGTVPGPLIRVTEGDRVRVILQNDLPEPTSIHWHGMPVPNAMDGMTPVPPGQSFTYEFTAPPAGSFMYHSHIASDRQVMVGLYAPLIVDPKTPEAEPPAVDMSWMLSEWRIGPDGQTYPAMPMAGMEPNYFTINGKAYPETPTITVKRGDRVRIRLAAIGQFTHPMHLHGMNFKVVALDGVSLPPEQQLVRNTIPVNPGELVDIEFVADNPGEWMFHCHVLHHVTNDGAEPGGLLAIVKVTE